jgi:hypothetical protein
MFRISQRVRNAGAEAVTLLPWARIRRERTPTVAGFYILHEGFIAVQDGRLHEVTYSDGKSAAATSRGPAWESEAAEGWAGLSDKYWLTALTRADGGTRLRSAFRHVAEGGVDRWQVDVAPPARSPSRPARRTRWPRASSPGPRRCSCSTATPISRTSRTSTRRLTSAGSTGSPSRSSMRWTGCSS